MNVLWILSYRSRVSYEDLCSAVLVCCRFDIQTLQEISIIFIRLRKYHVQPEQTLEASWYFHFSSTPRLSKKESVYRMYRVKFNYGNTSRRVEEPEKKLNRCFHCFFKLVFKHPLVLTLLSESKDVFCILYTLLQSYDKRF